MCACVCACVCVDGINLKYALRLAYPHTFILNYVSSIYTQAHIHASSNHNYEDSKLTGLKVDIADQLT